LRTQHAAVSIKKSGPARWRALMDIGAGEKSRTPDLRITNALLYQLSYTGAEARNYRGALRASLGAPAQAWVSQALCSGAPR
jgi:hypothetical protein